MRYLVEVHARPLSRSCDCVGLSRAAWYQPPLHWTVRDAEIIAALAEQFGGTFATEDQLTTALSFMLGTLRATREKEARHE